MSDRRIECSPRKIYKCHVVFITPLNDKNQAKELPLDQIFYEENDKMAILTTEKWANNRLKKLFSNDKEKHTEIFSVEVAHFHIGKPDNDGYIPTNAELPFFKWRASHDCEQSLQEKIVDILELYDLL